MFDIDSSLDSKGASSQILKLIKNMQLLLSQAFKRLVYDLYNARATFQELI